MSNIDKAEIAKFSSQAAQWWDTTEMKGLHQINPLRVHYINEKAQLKGKHLLDIGCGGGIFTESAAQNGAQVTGIDVCPEALQVAKLHQQINHLNIQYELTTAEDKAKSHPQAYEVVTCLELLEHVPDPKSIVQACAQLVKPGGHVFFSTLNRTLMAYLQAIIAGEYVLKFLPKHTHDYSKFIKPSELTAWCRDAGLSALDIIGIQYSPFTREFQLSKNISVNYLMWLRK